MRQAVVALNQRDADSFVGLIVQDFEWTTPAASVEMRTYRGRTGARQFFAESERAWASIEGRPDEIRPVGDLVLMLGEISWRGRPGAVDVTGPLASVIEFEDGKIRRIRTYRTGAEALAAAGLEVEPLAQSGSSVTSPSTTPPK